MTEEVLQAIEARAEDTTLGPWHAEKSMTIEVGCRCGSCWVADGDIEVSTNDGTPLTDGDAIFISHAHTDMAALVAEVRRQRDLLDDVRGVLLEAQNMILTLSHNGHTNDKDSEAFDLADRMVTMLQNLRGDDDV